MRVYEKKRFYHKFFVDKPYLVNWQVYKNGNWEAKKVITTTRAANTIL